MKSFKSFIQIDELSGVAPKSKGEHKFVHSTYMNQIKDPGDLEKVGPEEIGPADTKTGQGKRKIDRLDNKQKFGESVELEENYRTLAKKGIGAESKDDVKVGHGVDYYHPKTGDKHMGKIHSTSDKGYVVKDDKTGEKHSFDYYRREEVELEGSELDEADFTKAQTVMAHTIGKHFKKKGVGDESQGGPFAVASAMVRDKPAAAKKAYATIKAKMKNEDHQDMLMALYDELNEDNREIFEDMLDSNPEKLISFAMSQASKE